MSTAAALLRTIRDAPDDDTARLVYADFVEEEGDPARGAFIRTQVELARTPGHDPARRALEDREHELLAENESRWLNVAPDSRAYALSKVNLRNSLRHLNLRLSPLSKTASAMPKTV